MNAQIKSDAIAAPAVDTLRVADVMISRLRSDRFDLAPGPASPMIDAISVIVQLRDFAAHTLWRQGRVVHAGGHAQAALAITNLQSPWRCHHRSPFDNVRFQFSRAAIESLVEDGGRLRLDELPNPQGGGDPVVLGLAMALLPALEDPATASRLFVDQVLVALQTHLLEAYGSHHLAERTGKLARWQELRATEILAASLQGDLSMAEVAMECGLSRSHFSKAFKQSTGKTPHAWLQAYRITTATRLLLGPMPVADIATCCGFADQSHLTRVFTKMVGVPPSRWRRSNR